MAACGGTTAKGPDGAGGSGGAPSLEAQRDACEDRDHVLVRDELGSGEPYCGQRCATDGECVALGTWCGAFPRAIDAENAPTDEAGACEWIFEPPSPCAGTPQRVCRRPL